MKILIIDGQGGRLGRQLTEGVKARFPQAYVIAVGTNSAATLCMQKGGADAVATGENSVRVCAATADYILGPVAIVIANSLLGEITPIMAEAVSGSAAVKILIPINKCNNLIAGVKKLSIGEMIEEALALIGDGR